MPTRKRRLNRGFFCASIVAFAIVEGCLAATWFISTGGPLAYDYFPSDTKSLFIRSSRNALSLSFLTGWDNTWDRDKTGRDLPYYTRGWALITADSAGGSPDVPGCWSKRIGSLASVLRLELSPSPIQMRQVGTLLWNVKASFATLMALVALVVLGPWTCLAVFRLIRSKRRAKQGRCLSCGYDQRGSTGPVCPECGVPAWPIRP